MKPQNCNKCEHDHCSGFVDDDNLKAYCSHGIAEAIRNDIRSIIALCDKAVPENICNSIDFYLDELERRTVK